MEQTRLAPDCWYEMEVHRGQRRALESTKRFVLVLAGWQSGKTVTGPPWLLQEIKARGPGDYLIASPTYPLMMKKVLPEFLGLFKRAFKLGEFVGQPRNCFTFSDAGALRMFGHTPATPTQIFFGHAGDPDSLESATYKGAWLDEAGQNGFRLESWEAIQGRLSISQGRVLITTRPYNLGWLKQQLYDPWEAAKRDHPDIEVVHFRSIDNPAFPRAEYERARASMPGWRFRMKYDALFERPAGLIYDSFDPTKHTRTPFALPVAWRRFVGVDFGPVNTAALFLAEEQGLNGQPTGRYFAYREHHPGAKKAPEEHVRAILAGEPMQPYCVGGSSSEDEWRDKFASAGLPVHEPPVKDVEVGIDTVYAACVRGELVVFDNLVKLLDQLASYSRELDDAGEPTEKIEGKASYHLLDCLRYVLVHLKGAPRPAQPVASPARPSYIPPAHYQAPGGPFRPR